ncbi:MAG: argininosuccinate lyase [Candidatus Omnitrophica bacterium]|nr:argininosuccinate lyase [Candidatus Omnitrophota bacterium]
MAKLWGGRFEGKKMDPQVLEFTSSLDVDKVLTRYDCAGSKAHVAMLEKCGYLSRDEKRLIISALDDFMLDFENNSIDLEKYEDIHSAVQDYVESKAPEAAKKMRTGVSRNEQVVSDVRLYCKDSVVKIEGLIKGLQKELVALAKKNLDVIIPGYTHLNRAQPVLFSHLIMAYVEMLDRDRARVLDAGKRCDISVMGSGALAGSALALDRKFVANKLGFASLSSNSIDSVSDRDFMIEFIAALSIAAVHLSRISEDFILYSTSEFGFLDIGEAYCTGSSLMPQKKNPDVLELIRGKAPRIIGALNSILVLLKGLPHSYNRDLQEDKKYLFESVEVAGSILSIMTALVGTVRLVAERAGSALKDEFIYATDLAEYLVAKGVSFKDAHMIVGGMIKHCVERGINISDLSITEIKGFSREFGEDIYGYLNCEMSVKMKKTEGSTNPDLVEKEISAWEKRLRK